MNKLVIDVGGTAIKIALMNDNGKILERQERKTPHDSLQQFLDVICEVYALYQDQVDGLAFSLPGNIDSETGQIYAPGALAYNANTNLIDELHQRIDVDIAIENDGKCAALAEIWQGNLKDCQSGVVMILGTGIGGGIVLDRKVLKGKHFFAGELSYLSVEPHLNGFESVFAMKGSTLSLVMNVAHKKGLDPKSIDGKKVFEMIEAKDEIACACLDEMCDILTTRIYNLQCLLDCEKVLIGGGVSQQPLLLQNIQDKLSKIYEKLPFPIPQAHVETCAFYNDSNLLGALYNFKQHFPQE